MLLQVGQKREIDGLELLFGKEGFENIEKYFQTANKEFFKQLDAEKKFLGKLVGFPNKTFSFVFLRALDFMDPQQLMKAKSLCTKGIIFHNTAVNAQFDKFIFEFSEIKRANRSHDKIKEINDEMEEKYKERKKAIKLSNKELKAKNKELEKEWKEGKKRLKEEFEKTLKSATDEQKKFMPKEAPYEDEPNYFTLSPLPDEPRYRDLPRFRHISIGDNNLQKKYRVAWKMFSSFEYFTIERTNFNIFIRRDEELNYTYSNLDKINMDSVLTRDEFIKYFNKNERNEPSLSEFRSNVSIDYNFLDVASENSTLFTDSSWIYKRISDEEEEELDLPPLSRIKPMHAASIFSGGMKFSKEIEIEDDFVLVKSAPIKKYTEKESVMNGKKIITVYEQNETAIGFYSMKKRELEMF